MQLKLAWTSWSTDFYVEFILTAILNGRTPAPLLERLAEVSKESQRTRQEAVELFMHTLGDLVDRWIDSGRCDGAEDAWKRNLASQSKKESPLIEVLRDYRRRNPPGADVRADGRFELWMLPSLGSTDPMQRARDMGIYCFIALLDSPTRERFSRCDGCSAYFVRARMPKKGWPVKRGTYCRDCEAKGSAIRTEESRSKRMAERIRWATDALLEWKPKRRFGELKDWIVNSVNARLPADQIPIKVNWVTRHWAEIEQEAERRRYAKSKAT